MARSYVIAKRYSKALLELATSQDQARGWSEALSKLGQVLAGSEDLQKLVKSPIFTADEKWAVFEDLSRQLALGAELEKFLAHVNESGRLDVLPDIIAHFQGQVLEQQNTTEASVESAIELSTREIEDLQRMLEKSIGKKIRLKVHENSELIAGLKIHVEGKTIDATLMSSLELMQRSLIADPVTKAKNKKPLTEEVKA